MMGKDFDDLASIKAGEYRRYRDKSRWSLMQKALSHAGTIKPFDLEIHKGEVIGSDRTSWDRDEASWPVLSTVADRAQTGTLKVKGKEVKINAPN